MSDTVYVVVFSTRHGDEVNVYESEQLAKTELASAVRTFWEEVAERAGTTTPPEDDDEALALYFENHHEDSYAIVEKTIIRGD